MFLGSGMHLLFSFSAVFEIASATMEFECVLVRASKTPESLVAGKVCYAFSLYLGGCRVRDLYGRFCFRSCLLATGR